MALPPGSTIGIIGGGQLGRMLAIAAAQLGYFQAVSRMDVGIALLIEYLGIVLVVLWVWALTRQRPHRLTVVGIVLALLGLALVLDGVAHRVLQESGHPRGVGRRQGDLELVRAVVGPKLSLEDIVDLANQNGGRDNISVILVRVPPEFLPSSGWVQRWLAKKRAN